MQKETYRYYVKNAIEKRVIKMDAEIHFNDKEVLECKDVVIGYHDYGLNIFGKNENVFVPYSNIKFVRELKNKKRQLK